MAVWVKNETNWDLLVKTGVEILVHKDTGEIKLAVPTVRRILNLGDRTIRDYLKRNNIEIMLEYAPTKGGIQPCKLLSRDRVKEIASRYAKRGNVFCKEYLEGKTIDDKGYLP